MSTDPSSRARPMDLITALEHDRKVAVAYWVGMLFMAAVLIVCWLSDDVGPGHPIFSVLLVGWTLMLGPGLVAPAIRLLPPRWCHVPARERVVHRVLGVSVFAWLLERSGWNRRNVYAVWGFSITRSHLLFRALAARAGGGAHAACFAIHAVLATAAVFAGHPWGAMMILLPGVVVHLYPVLLQRAIMLRVQPLLHRYGARVQKGPGGIVIAEQAAAGDARNTPT